MKIRNILMPVLLLSILLFALAACGDAQLSGKYRIADVLDDPEGTTFAELDEMYKADSLNLTDYCYMEFQDGGGFVITLFGGEEARGTYTRNGNILTLTSGGESADAVIDGKNITWTYETGAKLVFRKETRDDLPTGVLIGIIAGSAALLCTGGFAVWSIVRKRRRNLNRQGVDYL